VAAVLGHNTMFSKLTVIKSQLESAMVQDKLKAWMLSSVKKDILLNLDDDELIASFGSQTECHILLA
jgi:hypothetical protein